MIRSGLPSKNPPFPEGFLFMGMNGRDDVENENRTLIGGDQPMAEFVYQEMPPVDG